MAQDVPIERLVVRQLLHIDVLRVELVECRSLRLLDLCLLLVQAVARPHGILGDNEATVRPRIVVLQPFVVDARVCVRSTLDSAQVIGSGLGLGPVRRVHAFSRVARGLNALLLALLLGQCFVPLHLLGEDALRLLVEAGLGIEKDELVRRPSLYRPVLHEGGQSVQRLLLVVPGLLLLEDPPLLLELGLVALGMLVAPLVDDD